MFQEVYRNCRWRLVIGFLMFFCAVSIMPVVVPLSTLLSLISLLALSNLRASLCCAEILSFSFEKVMEAI